MKYMLYKTASQKLISLIKNDSQITINLNKIPAKTIDTLCGMIGVVITNRADNQKLRIKFNNFTCNVWTTSDILINTFFHQSE